MPSCLNLVFSARTHGMILATIYNMRNRYNQYRIMWIFVSFDLPTATKEERKIAHQFRKALIKNGFCMFQYSVYLRNCASRENAKVYSKRVKRALPKKGKVSILEITDRQFGLMEIYYGKNEIPLPPTVKQLELF